MPVPVYRDPMRPRPLLRTLVGRRAAPHRLEQRRTLADVAPAARVSMPYLSEVERGRKEASSEVLAAVCDALRIDLSDLLAEVWRDLAADRAPVRRRPTRSARGAARAWRAAAARAGAWAAPAAARAPPPWRRRRCWPPDQLSAGRVSAAGRSRRGR